MSQTLYNRIFVEDDAEKDEKPTCGTEKDRGKKLNIHSAGIYINNHCKFNFITKYDVEILAAIWPCGIVVHVAELFRSESKGQVYGQLHQLLQNNPFLASDLGMFYSL